MGEAAAPSRSGLDIVNFTNFMGRRGALASIARAHHALVTPAAPIGVQALVGPRKAQIGRSGLPGRLGNRRGGFGRRRSGPRGAAGARQGLARLDLFPTADKRQRGGAGEAQSQEKPFVHRVVHNGPVVTGEWQLILNDNGLSLSHHPGGGTR